MKLEKNFKSIKWKKIKYYRMKQQYGCKVIDKKIHYKKRNLLINPKEHRDWCGCEAMNLLPTETEMTNEIND